MKPSKLFLAFFVLAVVSACDRPRALTPEAEAAIGRLAAGGDLIPAARRAGELPLDPDDTAWQQTPEVEIPLVSQVSVAPRSKEALRSRLHVRALHNNEAVALRFSWADRTRDADVAGVSRFQDAVAVGFPVHYGNGDPLPYIGMGNPGRPVNIWHWKSTWEEDLQKGYQGVSETHPGMVPNTLPFSFLAGEAAGSPLSQRERKTSVENLLAEGFGTLTSVPSERLEGRGTWKEGSWNVVIRRPFRSKRGGVKISADRGLLPITFAIWDGSNEERNGMKGLTRWRFLHLQETFFKPAALPASVTQETPGDSARGGQLVRDYGCNACHSLPGQPALNDVGPNLTVAGALHRPEYLLESINEPNAIVVPAPGYFDPTTGTSTMPSFAGQIPEQDVKDIVEYLGSLR